MTRWFSSQFMFMGLTIFTTHSACRWCVVIPWTDWVWDFLVILMTWMICKEDPCFHLQETLVAHARPPFRWILMILSRTLVLVHHTLRPRMIGSFLCKIQNAAKAAKHTLLRVSQAVTGRASECSLAACFY